VDVDAFTRLLFLTKMAKTLKILSLFFHFLGPIVKVDNFNLKESWQHVHNVVQSENTSWEVCLNAVMQVFCCYVFFHFLTSHM